jgi:hypothetical protein
MDTAKYHRIIRGRREGVGSRLIIEEIGGNDKVYEEQQRIERKKVNLFSFGRRLGRD